MKSKYFTPFSNFLLFLLISNKMKAAQIPQLTPTLPIYPFSYLSNNITLLHSLGLGKYELRLFETHNSYNKINHPNIRHLKEYIDSFGVQNSYVILDNFKRVDLHFSDHPVQVRTPEPAYLRYGKRFTEVWVPLGLGSGNGFPGSSNITERLDCRLSKFINSIPPSESYVPWKRNYDICLAPDFYKFVSKIKPWNCLVQFAVSPTRFPQGRIDAPTGIPVFTKLETN